MVIFSILFCSLFNNRFAEMVFCLAWNWTRFRAVNMWNFQAFFCDMVAYGVCDMHTWRTVGDKLCVTCIRDNHAPSVFQFAVWQALPYLTLEAKIGCLSKKTLLVLWCAGQKLLEQLFFCRTALKSCVEETYTGYSAKAFEWGAWLLEHNTGLANGWVML